VPATRPANGRSRDQRATLGLRQRSPGRTRLSGVPRGRWLQRSALPKRKEIRHYSLYGVPATRPANGLARPAATRGLRQWSPGRTRLFGVPRGRWLQRSALPEKEENQALFTVRWCTGLSGVAATRPANGRSRDQRATRGLRQRSRGAPDCPVCHGAGGCNGRLRQKRKEIRHYSLSGGAPDCPVCQPCAQPTVGRAISGRHVDFANGHQGAPDCPVCHTVGGCNGRLRQKRKEIRHYSLYGGAPDCPVCQPRS
jgi:hypothetical protein